MMDDDEPLISDEKLIRLWHGRLPRSILARRLGVASEFLERRWNDLVRAGALPSSEPRPIDRAALLGRRPIEPAPPAPEPVPPHDGLLELLRKAHPERDPR
jgi:hypothetical protein